MEKIEEMLNWAGLPPNESEYTLLFNVWYKWIATSNPVGLIKIFNQPISIKLVQDQIEGDTTYLFCKHFKVNKL